MEFIKIKENDENKIIMSFKDLCIKEIISKTLFLREDFIRGSIESKAILAMKEKISSSISELDMCDEIKEFIKSIYKIELEFGTDFIKQYKISNNTQIKECGNNFDIQDYCARNNYLVEKTNSNGNIVYEIYGYVNNNFVHIENIIEIVYVNNYLRTSAKPIIKDLVLNKNINKGGVTNKKVATDSFNNCNNGIDMCLN